MNTKGINPQFQARIGGIVEGLLESRDGIREPLEQAHTLAAELRGYVEFEIAKLELVRTIGPLEPAAAAAMRRLQRLRDDFDPDKILASLRTIEALKEALWIYRTDDPLRFVPEVDVADEAA